MTQHKTPCQSITNIKYMLSFGCIVAMAVVGASWHQSDKALQKAHKLEIEQAKDDQKFDNIIQKLSDMHRDIKEQKER